MLKMIFIKHLLAATLKLVPKIRNAEDLLNFGIFDIIIYLKYQVS